MEYRIWYRILCNVEGVYCMEDTKNRRRDDYGYGLIRLF